MLVVCIISAQQRPQFTLFHLNKYYENAAYAGMDRSLSVVSAYRDQYSQLQGNPKSFYMSGDLPMYIYNGAAGFSIQNAKAGVIDLTHLRASANRVWNTPYGFLSAGGRLGLEFLNINGSFIVTPDGEYEGVIDHKDPFLDENPVSGVGFTWEVATYFYSKFWQVGLSIFDLPSHKYQAGSSFFGSATSASLIGQYTWYATDDWTLKPAFLIKGARSYLQAEVIAQVDYRSNTYGGIGFRGYNSSSFDAMSMFFGANISPKLKLTYAYDFGISALRSVHQGSHEIMVTYNLQQLIGLGLPPRITSNPRHL
jgi:type IX secretion system PorP/SprF family membrane protein